MYIPAHNQLPDREAALRLIRDFPLGTIVSSAENGRPFVSYLPFVIADETPLTLLGHFARANPQWKELEGAEVLVAFHGAHGYISPRFYADRTRNVPTWNYSTVHCTGTVRLAAGDQTRPILRRLVEHVESGAPDSWSIDELDDEYFDRLQKAIVAFSIGVTDVTAKFKLSQNKSDGEPEHLIRALRATGRESDRLLADDMARANTLSS